MDRAGVMQWVDRYERAWRDQDPGAVSGLFTEDAAYRSSPYEPNRIGRELREFWLEDAAEPFTMTAEAVAVEDDRAVVRVEVHYPDRGQEYRDLWVLRFADDGRVVDFEEWAYWPGKPYVSDATPS